MFPLLFVLFIVIPLIEITLLIQAGGIIGVLPTVALVVLTAVIGAWLVRRQGFDAWTRLNEESQRGELPARPLFDGACILIAGALLMTPGFVTDTIGFLLLTPPVRSWAIRQMKKRGSWQTVTVSSSTGYERDGHGGRIVDVEYEEHDRSR